MTKSSYSANVVARASIQRKFLDAQPATQHLSLASFAHELELVQERYEFGMATRHDVAEVEDRLVAAWRGLMDLSLPEADNEVRH